MTQNRTKAGTPARLTKRWNARRADSRRRCAGLLLGAALLAGAGAGAAHAQTETEIWSATLTVATGTGIHNGRTGYSEGSHGSLSPDKFSYKGATGTVFTLHTTQGGTFFEIGGGVTLTNWTLHIGTSTLLGSAATSAGRTLFWLGSGPSWSDGDSVTVKLTTTEPGAPRSVSAAPTGRTTATLSWAAPASIGGSAITAYEYRASPDGGENWGEWTEIPDSAALTSHGVSGLLAGTLYQFQMRAKNTAGTGLWSETAEAATDVAPVTVVPHDWSLIPSGLGLASRFRLIFVTSTTGAAQSTDIAHYNQLVQELAAAGHAAIRPYARGFRVVGSTATVNARDNTSTTHTTTAKGVPIYWLGGNKVADDYVDFYDSTWDDEENVKDERGRDIDPDDDAFDDVWTGTQDDGTKHAAPLGNNTVSFGVLNVTTLVDNSDIVNPLDGGVGSPPLGVKHFYALSSVLEVGPPTVAVSASWPLLPDGVGLGDRFRLIFLTSGTRDATSTDIADYNEFVQDLAAKGHGFIRAHSGGFRALASTAAVAARDNAAAVGTGYPVYWLGGAKAADDYADLYDGSWDEEATVRDEAGTEVKIPAADSAGNVWTGSTDHGTGLSSKELGTTSVGHGQLNSVALLGPLNADDGESPKGTSYPLYGLSPVFEVRVAETVSARSNWLHSPPGLQRGEMFRLLFVDFGSWCSTSGEPGKQDRRPPLRSTDIGDYNDYIQCHAEREYNNRVIREHASRFRALVSTPDVDARDNTGTAGRGVPIYWLGGNPDYRLGGNPDRKVSRRIRPARRWRTTTSHFYGGSWEDGAQCRMALLDRRRAERRGAPASAACRRAARRTAPADDGLRAGQARWYRRARCVPEVNGACEPSDTTARPAGRSRRGGRPGGLLRAVAGVRGAQRRAVGAAADGGRAGAGCGAEDRSGAGPADGRLRRAAPVP